IRLSYTEGRKASYDSGTIKRSGAQRSHFDIVFSRRSIVQVRVPTLLGLHRPSKIAFSFIWSDLLSTTTINELPESQRSGWARQNSMANNMEYLLAYEIQRITRVY
ncbi:unnamed protein product, partial [Musa acuminata subsp. malaccensis]